ncbi:MAG: alternative ribosome rescue aminoacyl-tRNA hydrolase ArfB [Bacteroidota bacterium]
MAVSKYDIDQIIKECRFATSRSSGPGGQNVNKVETRVTIKWNIEDSEVFTDEQKKLLSSKLEARINKEGDVIISSQGSRSQLQNKEEVIKMLELLIGEALVVPKKRRKTRPTKASVEKRIESKRKQSERKKLRGKTGLDYN